MRRDSFDRKTQSLLSWNCLDWTSIEERLTVMGFAHVPRMVGSQACQKLIDKYDDSESFRRRIVMERHNFGIGEYSYFSEPLPALVAEARSQLYTHLAPVANRLMHAMRLKDRYPDTLDEFRKRCHAAGQTKPTPLILRYEVGGFNCLHRDLYGPLAFPLQVMVMLSQKGEDFEGGEFVLVENRPRQQSRTTVIAPDRGDVVIFPVSERPVQGKRSMLRATIRHGVSRIHWGKRWTLGIIFHDAQ